MANTVPLCFYPAPSTITLRQHHSLLSQPPSPSSQLSPRDTGATSEAAVTLAFLLWRPTCLLGIEEKKLETSPPRLFTPPPLTLPLPESTPTPQLQPVAYRLLPMQLPIHSSRGSTARAPWIQLFLTVDRSAKRGEVCFVLRDLCQCFSWNLKEIEEQARRAGSVLTVMISYDRLIPTTRWFQREECVSVLPSALFLTAARIMMRNKEDEATCVHFDKLLGQLQLQLAPLSDHQGR